IALVGLLSVGGCAYMSSKNEPVSFNDPALVLKITESKPTPEESNGISLRLLVPPKNEIHAEEDLKVYSQLHDGRGLSLNLRQKITVTYKPVAGKDSYIQHTVITFEGEGGKVTEALEISPRGEIVRFIEGHHKSKIGKFRILSESRTPMYPEGPVKIGDKWRYEEKVDARLESFWIKEENPTPYNLQADSQLTGFAQVNGHRCAVIKTTSTQTKTEIMKILLNTVTVDIRSAVEETAYLDYANGILIAKVTQTRSHSLFPSLNMEDDGVSQSIYRVIEQEN
ncbi:MAG: hypothetical protein PHE61_07420, partial [Candidatus Omnitrophica bacterium]|nr:hypothetical protein [Candidatus Omnitrophota bacterium]